MSITTIVHLIEGFIIGMLLERLGGISFKLQKAIKQFKENQRKQKLRKQGLLNKDDKEFA